MNKNGPLLIVEDSDEDFEVTVWALNQSGNTRRIIRCTRAEEALSRLFPTYNPRDVPELLPCLVLLDLNLPGMDGRQLLAAMHKAEPPSPIPIVILSTSNNPRDVDACYRLGAAGYICKPLSLEDFTERMRGLNHYWFNTVTLPEERV